MPAFLWIEKQLAPAAFFPTEATYRKRIGELVRIDAGFSSAGLERGLDGIVPRRALAESCGRVPRGAPASTLAKSAETNFAVRFDMVTPVMLRDALPSNIGRNLGLNAPKCGPQGLIRARTGERNRQNAVRPPRKRRFCGRAVGNPELGRARIEGFPVQREGPVLTRLVR